MLPLRTPIARRARSLFRLPAPDRSRCRILRGQTPAQLSRGILLYQLEKACYLPLSKAEIVAPPRRHDETRRTHTRTGKSTHKPSAKKSTSRGEIPHRDLRDGRVSPRFLPRLQRRQLPPGPPASARRLRAEETRVAAAPKTASGLPLWRAFGFTSREWGGFSDIAPLALRSRRSGGFNSFMTPARHAKDR